MSQPGPPESRPAQLRQALAGLSGPLGFADLDAFDANARALVHRARGKPIRLATKSLRCLPLIRRALAHPGFQGVMCFNPREAAWLAEQGIDDLLLAYPTVDQHALQKLAHLLAAGHDLKVMVDSEAHLPLVAAAAQSAGVVFPVCMELDVSQDLPGLRFGSFRSPVRDVTAALRLAEAIGRNPHLRLVGLMAYEGQIAGLGNAGQDARARLIRMLQTRFIPQIAERRAAVVHALKRAGHTLTLVNAGGTGSLESSAAEAVVTEVAAGSGLYSPLLFDGYAGFRHQPAVGFALSVTRRPAADMVTCHGGGYVASGPVGASRAPQPFYPAGLRLIPEEGLGEVQTPLRLPPDVRLGLGDLVLFRHAKAGELCEHFTELHTIAGTRRVGTVQTYRGAGQQFS